MIVTKKELKKANLSEPADRSDAEPRFWWMDGLAADASYTRKSFDPTTVFHEDRELTVRVLEAYEMAADKALASARLAVLSPHTDMERAIWDEAVAATLEAILHSVPRTYENDHGSRESIEAARIYLPVRR